MQNIHKKSLSLSGTAAFFVCLLAFTPHPVYAQAASAAAAASGLAIITTSPTDTMSNEIQVAANAAIKAFGDNLQAALGLRNTQAVVDATDKATLDKKNLDLTEKYTVPADNGSCPVTTLEQASNTASHGAKSLAGSLGGGGAQQTTGVTPATKILQACANGYIDTTNEYPDLKTAIKSGCTVDNTRIDADINFATVSKDNMMQLPAPSNGFPYGIIVSGGVLTLPPVTSGMPQAQKDFIDAMNVCINELPPDPANVAATGSTTVDKSVLGVHAQRMSKLEKSASYNDCLNEVLRNTALPPPVAQKLGGDFQTMSDAQQQECTMLTDEGISDPALTTCGANTSQTTGLSLAKAEELKNTRFASPNYAAILEEKRSLTPEDVSMIQEQHVDTAQIVNLLREIEGTLKVIAANTMPKGSAPGPQPMDNVVHP